ncbi:hypothetical protein [Kitasatospora sp. NPDC057015]|uniref:hypothetical protein n=1 Tax=Kitasatospora sp. NPDC057015 TaxID=3346001 RepID=UPI00362A84E0
MPVPPPTNRTARPARPLRAGRPSCAATPVGYCLNEEFVRGIVEMKGAKGGDSTPVPPAPRTPPSPTTFEQWCAQTLKPSVLA